MTGERREREERERREQERLSGKSAGCGGVAGERERERERASLQESNRERRKRERERESERERAILQESNRERERGTHTHTQRIQLSLDCLLKESIRIHSTHQPITNIGEDGVHVWLAAALQRGRTGGGEAANDWAGGRQRRGAMRGTGVWMGFTARRKACRWVKGIPPRYSGQCKLVNRILQRFTDPHVKTCEQQCDELREKSSAAS